jgi:hypothetical protein
MRSGSIILQSSPCGTRSSWRVVTSGSGLKFIVHATVEGRSGGALSSCDRWRSIAFSSAKSGTRSGHAPEAMEAARIYQGCRSAVLARATISTWASCSRRVCYGAPATQGVGGWSTVPKPSERMRGPTSRSSKSVKSPVSSTGDAWAAPWYVLCR